MMAQSLITKCSGLHTYASDISAVPLGSLKQAINVNINQEDIIEPRKGFEEIDYTISSQYRAKKFIFWDEKVFVHLSSGSLQYYNPSSGFTSLGDIGCPLQNDQYHMFCVSSQNKNLYLASAWGIRKLEAYNSSVIASGIPKAINMDVALTVADGTALEDDHTAGYRYLIGRKDVNGNIYYGGVSTRELVKNTQGTTKNVTVTCYLPTGLTTSNFIQLYKVDSTVDSVSDEMQLCYETQITSTHISNGYVTITDVVDPSLLGATIYTASSQQGMVNDNAIPPSAGDIAEYKGTMFFANVFYPHRLIFTILGVGTSSGLAIGDTITIVRSTTTEVYTAHDHYSLADHQFAVSTNSSAVAAVAETAKSLIKLINAHSTIVKAYSLDSDVNPIQGKILLEALDSENTSNPPAFTAVSSKPAAFSPALTSPAGTYNTSTADTFKNGLVYSKPNQPESVPLKNIIKVGSSSYKIKRIVPLRDGLFIFKEGEGVFVLKGDSESNFVVDQLDNTAKIYAPNSLCVVNNVIYGLFESGICEVSETGVSIISNPIKDQIIPIFSDSLSIYVKAYGFGFGDDINGKYILSIPIVGVSISYYTGSQIVFDTFSRRFTNWNMRLAGASINPYDRKIYIGKGDSSKVMIENKDESHTDYGDVYKGYHIDSYSGKTLYLHNGHTGIEASDIIVQGNNYAMVESLDVETGSVIVGDEISWSTGAGNPVYYVKGIDCTVEWNPDFASNPSALKHYYELIFMFRKGFQRSATVTFTSNSNENEQDTAVVASFEGNGAFGNFEFGEYDFGGNEYSQAYRVGIPRDHARCALLNVKFNNKVAWSDFALQGISLSFNETSTRVVR